MKKILIVALVIITIVNIVAASAIFIDISILQTPETTIKLDFLELNSKEIVIQTKIDVYNPNSFKLITKDFEIITSHLNGSEISNISISGGIIDAGENKSFISKSVFSFSDSDFDTLISKISGEVGFDFGFTQKTLPIKMNIITSVDNIINEISVPHINIHSELSEVTKHGINMTGSIDVFNPNSFEIFIDYLSVTIINEKDKIVGEFNVVGGALKGKSSHVFKANGMVLLEALDSESLTINISGSAGAKIAGFSKSISFSSEGEILIPDIDDILLSKDKPTIVSIKVDRKITSNGFENDILMEVYNPNTLDLYFEDIICSFYSVKNDFEDFIGMDDDIQGGLVAGGSSRNFTGNYTLPFSSLFDNKIGDFNQDWLLISVRSNVTVMGINQTTYVEINGYHDLHPFT